MNIKAATIPDGDDPAMFNLKAEYVQKADSCTNEEFNELTIKTQDGGDGFYFVIETDRWAFDDPKELIDVLNDFIVKLDK